MPYSEVNGEILTPDGCRPDKGLVINILRGTTNHQWLIFDLTDGSRYTLEGPVTEEFERLFLRRADPGCAWNAHIARARLTNLHKGLPRRSNANGTRWRAGPPMYDPVNDPSPLA